MVRASKKIRAVIIALLIVLASTVSSFSLGAGMNAFAAPDNSMSNQGLSIGFSKETGRINQVTVNDKEIFVEKAESGFVVTDMANNQKYNAQMEIRSVNRGFEQAGKLDDSGLDLKATYSKFGRGIKVEGQISDTTGKDRLVKIEYLIPVNADNMYWYNDIEGKVQIKKGLFFDNGYAMIEGNKASVYPFSVISDGKSALSIGVPMDPPYSSLVAYDYSNDRQHLLVRFNFVLSKITEKTSSKADFSFVIYAPELPEWGMRSAAQGYYDMYPQFFERRVEGGNWLFQHAYDQLPNIEDYYFKFNETPGSYAFDEKNGVVSLRYTSPGEQSMNWPGRARDPEPTYEEYMERFEYLSNADDSVMDQDFKGMRVKDVAKALANSADLKSDNKYYTYSWYDWGQSVFFFVNHDPEIPGLNGYKLQQSLVDYAQKEAEKENSTLGGTYIDNLAGGNFFNYSIEHFKYSDYPLLWDNTKRVALPHLYSMHEYTKAIRDWMHKENKIVFANVVFPEKNGAVKYVHLVDAPGSEVGPDWGHDLHIQRLRRTLAYRKPWMLLLTDNLAGMEQNKGTLEDKEKIMQDSMVYGLFANVIGYRVPIEDYEACRFLFKKYTPIMKLTDTLGWEPVTFARYEGDSPLIVERFGNPKDKTAVFTVKNVTDKKFDKGLVIDLNALGVDKERQGSLIAYDMLNNKMMPVEAGGAAGTMTVKLNLEADDVGAILVDTKSEAWEVLNERVISDINRIATALTEIPKKIEGLMGLLPDTWDEFSVPAGKIAAYKDKTPKEIEAGAQELKAAMIEAIPLGEKVSGELINFKDIFDSNFTTSCPEALSIISGFFPSEDASVPANANASVPAKENGTNNNSLMLLVYIGLAIIIIAVINVILYITLIKRPKRS